ncbi:MAG: hypothetical protein ABF291_10020 [Desulfobacterales bacterium]
MSSKRNLFHDRFTFSLRGMTATASFFITPVIADDTINKAWDEKLHNAAREQRDPPEDQAADDFSCQQPLSESLG